MCSLEAYKIDFEVYHSPQEEITFYQNILFINNSISTKTRISHLIEKFLALFNVGLDTHHVSFLVPTLKSYIPYTKNNDYIFSLNQLPKSINNRPLINLMIVNKSPFFYISRKRGCDRTVGDIVELVKKMEEMEGRKIETIFKQRHRRKKMNIFAKLVKLDDETVYRYFFWYMEAKSLGFDFKLHFHEKFRFLLKFVNNKKHPKPKKKSHFYSFRFFRHKRMFSGEEEIEMTIGGLYEIASLVLRVGSVMSISKSDIREMIAIVKDGIQAGFDFEKYRHYSIEYLKSYLEL